MKASTIHLLRGIILLSSLLGWTVAFAESDRVTLLRAPGGGIQPQAAVDAKGVVHLIYYKGESGEGDIFYARKGPGEENFSKAVQINSQPGSAMSAGTI